MQRVCVFVRMLVWAVQTGSFSIRNEGERWRQGVGGKGGGVRCKDSFETKAASPVKAKTGKGGIECMKKREEEACEPERRADEN